MITRSETTLAALEGALQVRQRRGVSLQWGTCRQVLTPDVRTAQGAKSPNSPSSLPSPQVVRPGGLVSILAYIGHAGGNEEYQAVAQRLAQLPHRWGAGARWQQEADIH